jgi:hypothetical protein
MHTLVFVTSGRSSNERSLNSQAILHTSRSLKVPFQVNDMCTCVDDCFAKIVLEKASLTS